MDRWSALGEVLQGLGALVLGLAAVVGGGWALYRYFQERTRQIRLDLLHVHENRVAALRSRYEMAIGRAEELDARTELEGALVVQTSLLEGMLTEDPELATVGRRMLRPGLQAAIEEYERIRRGEGPRR